ncbi:MAG: hypothetical protein Q9164_000951, partial [Protoblastenia rupestris]
MAIARVAVHFQSITDRFSPYDATFNYSTPAELKESALSSELALHTAASLKSSSDPHLPGITEDDQDTTSEATQKADGGEAKERTDSSQSHDDAQARHEKVTEILSAMRTHEQGLRQRSASDTNKALPPTPVSPVRDQPKAESVYDLDPRPSVSDADGRMSSQSARPSTRDLSSPYEYKPKFKYGPRPSSDTVGQIDSAGSNKFRPVSTLPPGLRMPARKTMPEPPKSEQKQTPFLVATHSPRELLASPPPKNPLHTPDRIMSLSPAGLPTPPKTPDSKSVKMTPEKRRLMKALQLRQKHLAAQNPVEEVIQTDNLQAEPKYDKELLKLQPPSAELKVGPIDTEDIRQDSADDLPNLHQRSNLDQEGSLDDFPSVSRDPQDSPISGLEPWEGQSTQASSISEEDSILQKPSHTSEDTIIADREEQDYSVESSVGGETLQKAISKEDSIPCARKVERLDDANSICQAPNTTSGTPIALEGTPAPQESTLDGQHLEAESSATDFNNDRQDTDGVAHVKKTAFVGTPSATERPLTRPLNDFISPTESGDTDQAPLEGLDDADVRSMNQLDLSLVSNQDPAGPACSFSKEQPLQLFSESHVEVPPFQDIPTDEMSKESREPGASPNGHNVLSSHAMFKETTGHGSTAKTVLPKQYSETSSNPPITKSLQHELPLPQNMQTEDSAPQNLISTIDVNSKAPAIEFSPAVKDSTTSRPHSPETTTISSTVEIISESAIERKVKRHGIVSPTKRTSSPDQSDEQFLSDDSFMEELKTACVQEAKPISVSKSPIKPVFSRSGSEQKPPKKTQGSRSISSPLGYSSREIQNILLPSSPSQSSARSFSASTSQFMNPQSIPALPPKKQIGVSSSISQRIKALEQLSSRPTSPTLQATPQATFISLRDRKSSLRSPTGPSDSIGNSINLVRPNTAHASRSLSPETIRIDSSNYVSKPRPESVSVTATIVRDANNKAPQRPLNPSEPCQTHLHPSPLFVEHQKMAPPPLSPLEPPRPHYARHASARSGSSSSTNEMSPNSRRASFASKRSNSSRNESDFDLPRSASDKSLGSMSGLEGIKEERRDSKRSRLLKRMSSISTMSRRSIASALSPGPKEASITEHQEPIAQMTVSKTIDLGDVNIQFPDTLLWKRRHVLIDEHGVLVLSPSSLDNNTKVITKRFPLSDFRQPYLPDQDRQELANSVILDFKSGSTLQCACETPQGQVHIFN